MKTLLVLLAIYLLSQRMRTIEMSSNLRGKVFGSLLESTWEFRLRNPIPENRSSDLESLWVIFLWRFLTIWRLIWMLVSTMAPFPAVCTKGKPVSIPLDLEKRMPADCCSFGFGYTQWSGHRDRTCPRHASAHCVYHRHLPDRMDLCLGPPLSTLHHSAVGDHSGLSWWVFLYIYKPHKPHKSNTIQ